MSCLGNSSDINQTFIIEPLSITASTIVSACTALYTNNLISCSGDTNILLNTGVIIFNGDIYTNNEISASTINATNYYSGGTDLFNIINNTTVTGGTFNDVTKTLSLYKPNGSVINVTGFTDYFITGGTFNPNNKVLSYRTNNNVLIDTYLPVRTFIYSSASTVSNVILTIDSITGITNNSNCFVVSYINAYNDNVNYGFWKRTLAINKLSGITTIIGENSDFDRVSSGMTSSSVIYSASSGNVIISISGETSKNYTWSSNWEIIK